VAKNIYLIALYKLQSIIMLAGNRINIFCKPSPPTFTSKYYKLAAGAAACKPKTFLSKKNSKILNQKNKRLAKPQSCRRRCL
jgi:hypothetical protein